jgi:hypothetical protein
MESACHVSQGLKFPTEAVSLVELKLPSLIAIKLTQLQGNAQSVRLDITLINKAIANNLTLTVRLLIQPNSYAQLAMLDTL